MKIAVCLYGNEYSISSLESIKNFFNSRKNEFFFFGYTSCDSLYSKFSSNFNFLDFKLDNDLIEDKEEYSVKEIIETVNPIRFLDVTNSIMQVNLLKRNHEVLNDFDYNCVVNCNFNKSFNFLSSDGVFDQFSLINQTKVYSSFFIDKKSYNIGSLDTSFYFSSSITSDIISNFHRFYVNGDFFKLTKSGYTDSAFKQLNIGSIYYKWMMLKNIFPSDIKIF